MAGKTIGRVIIDRALLAGLAILLAAPLVLILWMLQRSEDTAEAIDDLSAVSDDAESLVTRNLNDADLAELDRFSDLQVLQLTFSDATDAGMAAVGRRTTLRVLWLNCQQVTDTGLRQLEGLTSLEEFVVAGMPRITHEGLSILQGMRGLKRLSVMRCTAVEDGLGEHLNGLPLESIDLEQSTEIGDETARALAEIATLHLVNLNFCDKITDDGIAALAILPQLETLTLHGLRLITDDGLKALHQAGSLKLLELPIHGAPITKPAIEELRAALPGCRVVDDRIVLGAGEGH